MTKTLTTETIKLWRINAEITLGETDELDPENNAAKAILALTAELLRYREAAENPSCWEIAGQLFTTKEDALKPGYIGTPEPLYDGPVLTDDREAQPVAEYGDAYQGAREDLSIWKRRALEAEDKVRHLERMNDHLVKEVQGEHRFGEPIITAPPAPAVTDEKAITPFFDTLAFDTAKMVMCDVNRRSDFLGGDIQLLARIQCRVDEACRAAMLAQPVSQGYKLNSPETPDGWKLVPIDATRAMIDAAQRVEEDGYDAMHKAMLAAAPEGGNG